MNEFLKYRYLVYQNNAFIAELKNVVSEFKYTQAINTAGAQIEIEIGNKFDDVGADLITENIIDESGNFVVDESGNNVLGSSVYEFNDIPIGLGNRIKVYREDNDNPNGVVVFDGLISSWQGSHLNNTIKIKVVSWGVQLANYIVGAGNTGQAVAQGISDIEYEARLRSTSKFPVADNTLAQTFVLATDTIISSVQVRCRVSSPTVLGLLRLVGGTPSAPGVVYSTVGVIIENLVAEYVEFIFSSPLELLAGTYHWEIENYGYDELMPVLYISANSAGGYASGELFDDGVGTGDDATFIVNSSGGETSTTYDQSDPGNIIRNIIGRLAGQGSTITFDDDSVELTGTSVTYGFILATALEGIQKAKELAPSHWYFYLDVANNYLHFHPRGEEADHIFKLGTHVHDMEFGFSLEEVKNTVYLTGGDTGGSVNLFLTDENAESKAQYGQWLERVSDNRITLEDTGQKIINGILNENANLTFKSRIMIPSKIYDIESIVLGQMAGFSNFNNLIDDLVLQITSIERTVYMAVLSLDSIPPRVSQTIEDTRKRLLNQETVDNPTAPS